MLGFVSRKAVVSLFLTGIVVLVSWGAPAQSHVVGSVGPIDAALTSLILGDTGGEVPPAMPQPWPDLSGAIVPGADVGYEPGESSVSPSGEYTYRLPLQTPDGRAGMAPSLSLTYSSGNLSNGVLGVGWSLSGLSRITRCAKTLASEGVVAGVSMHKDDAYCLDGQKLMAIQAPAGDAVEYRTEREAYAQIQSQGASSDLGPTQFTVRRKDGRILEYDAVSAKRQTGMPSGYLPLTDTEPYVRYVWVLAREKDRSGNEIEYKYTITNNGSQGLEVLPQAIEYTKHSSDAYKTWYRSVQFIYESRADTTFAWNAGVRTRLTQRLKTIELHAPAPDLKQAFPSVSPLVWQYNLAYTPSTYSKRSLLASVQRCGANTATSNPNVANHGCLWKKQFQWIGPAQADPTPQFVQNDLGVVPFKLPAGEDAFALSAAHYPYLMALDVDGDGSDDLLYQAGKTKPSDPQALFLFRAAHNPTTGATAPLALKQTVDPQIFGQTFVQDYLHGTVAQMTIQQGGYIDAGTGVFLQIPPTAPLEAMSLQHMRPVDMRGIGASQLWVSPVVTKSDALNACANQLLTFNTKTQRFELPSPDSPDSFVVPNAEQCGPLSLRRDVFFDFDGDGRLDLARLNDMDGPTIYRPDDQNLQKGFNGTTQTDTFWLAPYLFGSKGGIWRFYHNEEGQGLGGLTSSVSVTGADACPLENATTTYDYDPADQTVETYYWTTPGGNAANIQEATTRRAIPHDDYSPGVVLDRQGNGRGELAIGLDTLWGVDATGVARCDIPAADETPDVTDTEAFVNPVQAQASSYPGIGPNTSTYGDFNGDGLQDKLTISVVNGLLVPQVRWNTGRGLGPAVAAKGFTGLPAVAAAQWYAQDFNGDGLADLIVLDRALGTRLLFLSQGDGSFVRTVLPTLAPPMGNGMYQPPMSMDAFNSTTRMGDFNGDGFIDIATITAEAHLVLLQQVPHYDDRLKAVWDEPATVWPREAVEYSTHWSDKPEAVKASTYPVHTARPGKVVVRKLTRHDHQIGLNAPNATNLKPYEVFYSYEDPTSDLRGRGFLGFGKVRVWDPQRPMERVTTYDNRTGCDPTLGCDGPDLHEVSYLGRIYPGVGHPSRITTVVPILSPSDWEAGAQPVLATGRVTDVKFTDVPVFLNGGKTYDVQSRSWSSKEWEEPVGIDWTGTATWNPTSEHVLDTQGRSAFVAPGQVLRERRGTATYGDAWGNVTASSSQTTGGISQSQTTIYSNDSANWLLGLPTHSVATHNEADGTTATRTTDMNYTALGQPAYVYVEKGNADPGVPSTEHWLYDTYGLVIQEEVTAGGATVGPSTRTTRFEYAPYPGAPDERVYESQIWSPYEVTAYRPSLWMAVDPAFGVVTATLDVNGVQSQTVHDDLGRLVKAIRPDSTAPLLMSYAGRDDFYAGGQNGLVIQSTAQGTSKQVATDALGRTLSSRSQGFDGGMRATDRAYDMLGRTKSVSRPYVPCLTCQPSQFSVAHYDTLDRLISSVLPDTTTTTYTPDFLQTQSIDASGNRNTMTRDVDGRTLSSVDLLNGVPVNTSYHYGPHGVDTVTDDKGHKTQTGYDLLGRIKQQVDPDAGTTQLTYDGFGDVLTSTHLETHETTSFGYDSLGRNIGRSGPSGKTTLTYDTVLHGIGKLATTTSPDNVSTQQGYDVVGRMNVSAELVNGQKYKVELKYDPLGRLDQLLYPSVDSSGAPGLTLKYTYNPSAYLSEIGTLSGTTYAKLWHADSRNLDDALTHATFANGVTDIRTYTPELGRIQRLLATHNIATGGVNNASSLQNVFDIDYRYYPNGLVQIRHDAVTSRTEQFNYDALLRLSDWGATYNGITHTTHYEYDTLGNLLTASMNQVPLESNVYGVPGASDVMPHTLTQQTVGGMVTNYQYDPHGRQTVGGARALAKYTDFDLPRTVVMKGGSSTLAYDAAGNRVMKTSPGAETIYIGGLYEKRSTVLNGIEHVFHVAGPDGALAQIEQKDGSALQHVDYLISDALGSMGITMDATSSVTNRFFFEPFGKRIQASGLPPTAGVGDIKNGFTGQEHDDEFGLINFRGRLYDPQLKRMLSPDPYVTHPLFGQSWNPYSYVLNSPLSFNDPTGYQDSASNDGDMPPPVSPENLERPMDYIFGQDVIYGYLPPPAQSNGGTNSGVGNTPAGDFSEINDGTPGGAAAREALTSGLTPNEVRDRNMARGCDTPGCVWATRLISRMNGDRDPDIDTQKASARAMHEGAVQAMSIAAPLYTSPANSNAERGSGGGVFAKSPNKTDADFHVENGVAVVSYARQTPTQNTPEWGRNIARTSTSPSSKNVSVGTVVGAAHGADGKLAPGVTISQFIEGLQDTKNLLIATGVAPTRGVLCVCQAGRDRLGSIAASALGIPMTTFQPNVYGGGKLGVQAIVTGGTHPDVGRRVWLPVVDQTSD